jgi:hypothetical protein
MGENRDHTGYIESRHEIHNNNKWYIREYNPEFCQKLADGDYIPCGNSGDIPYSLKNGAIGPINYLEIPDGYTTCCFVYGKYCGDKRLHRRWTCCGQGGEYTIEEMKGILCISPKQV